MMKPYRPATISALLCGCVLVCSLFAFAAPSMTAAPARASKLGPILPGKDPLVRRAFDHFYNSEYDKAIQSFEVVAANHPENPFATNYLLSAVIFRELYRIGALDTESYAGNGF